MRANKLSFLIGCFVAGFLLLSNPTSAEAAPPVCNDSVCHPSESCPTCAECCFCGNGTCDGAETCVTCTADCGSCPIAGCGDGVCDSASEDCSSCSADCGECLGYTELTDFATCPKVLSACDVTTTSCCKRPFGSFNGRQPLIIPTDRCHQPIDSAGNKYSIPAIDTPKWCSNPGLDDADIVKPDGTIIPGTGMIEMYGLIYRCMQAGIPVYWAINPTKDPQALNEDQSNLNAQTYSDRDIDMWILSGDDTDGAPPNIGDALATCNAAAGCTAPVVRLNPDLTPAEVYDMQEFPLRGGAFVIAAADRDRFDELFTSTGEFAANAGSYFYDFSAVDVYEVQDGAVFTYQDFQKVTGPYSTVAGAPIAVKLDTPPPRLAVQDGGPAEIWLGRARLDQAAASGCEIGDQFSPADAVYCLMSNAAIENNQLRTGNFQWAWLHAPGLSCAAMDELDDFMTAIDGVQDGQHVMFMEQAFDTSEACTSGRFLGDPSIGMRMEATSGSAPYILRHPANIIAQVADVPAGFAQGSPSKWDWYGSIRYQAAHYDYANGGTLVRLVSEDASSDCSTPLNKSTVSCDIFDPAGGDNFDFIAYIRHENVPANGVAFYAAGNNVNPQSTTAHLRMTLNAFLALPTGLVDSTPDLLNFKEVTRSAPVLVEGAGLRTLYQGTFGKFDPPPGPPAPTFAGSASAGSFRFPHTPGHFRAIDVDSGTVLYDVADDDMIPPANIAGCGQRYSAACRTVFTVLDQGPTPTPTPVYFEAGSASNAALQVLLGAGLGGGPLSAADAESLMSRVLAGWPDGLGGTKPVIGGVDRSTPAVIGISPLAVGAADRPTIAYFGGLDGMLHAVCVDVAGPCDKPGRELWAFVPPTQLPKLALNTARVDGSPNVADLFGDFDGDGNREWRTILVFQTGSGETNFAVVAPSIIAMDITDPGDPIVLWVREASGLGLTLSTGPVRDAGISKPITFAAYNRGTNPTSGFTLQAREVDTANLAWSSDAAYPDRGDGNPSVPTSAIPSGASGVDMNQQGSISHVAVTTLFGDLWLLEADSGNNVYGSDPLFRFSEDYHPIGVPPVQYRASVGSRIHALIGSGGYADPFETAWAPDGVTQFVIGVWLESPVANINEDIADTSAGDGRAFVVPLDPGQRVFVQPVVSGDNVFIVTDSEDINVDTYGFGGASGLLTSYSLSSLASDPTTAPKTQTSLQSGAGGVDVGSSGEAFGGGAGADATNVAAPADYNPTGITTELSFTATTGRQVWLRLQ